MNAGHYRFFELVMSSICYLVLPDQFSRSILMGSLYFYNFLYGSFIYSMLIFMHTDR